MDQSNLNPPSKYPDPELSQMQNTTWPGQNENGQQISGILPASFSAGAQYVNSFELLSESLSSGQYGDSRSFDTPMAGMDNEEAAGSWSRELPGDDLDSMLDGYDSDPDYREHRARMIKLRDDIVDLRNGFLPNDDGDSLSRILGGAAVSRNRGQKREPRPRGRQPGQKVGPRKAAELTGDIKMRLGKAHDLFNAQDYAEASATLMEIIRINAEVPAAWELLAAIFEEERNIKEAVTCLMFAAQVSPKTKIPWIRAATLALSQQGPDRPYFLSQAQSCFAGGIRADPKDLECRRGKAAVLEERGYLTAAVSEYKYIVTRLPEETETLSKIAELCIDNGTCQIAIDVYKRSIAHFRTLPPAQAAVFDWTQIDIYVTLYEVVGQFYNAIAALKSLSRWILGRSTEMFWDQVTLTDCEWDTDESRKITVPGFISGQHPLASYELPLEFRVKLGLYRLSIGEQEESLHHLYFLDPLQERDGSKILEYPHLFKQAADQLYKMEVFDQALVFYEPLLNVAEYLDAALLVQIGRCFLRAGKIDLAEHTFRDAVELDGDETEARMELAKIHENRHELHTAMNLVNEVMLLRRDQHRRAPEKQGTAVDTEITKKPARSRVPRASREAKESKEPKESVIGQRVKADKRLEILSKGEELISHFQVFRNERDGMMAGDRESTTAWLGAAKALTDDFRGCKAFYPWDKYVTFMGYSGDSALHAATPLDADLTGIAERLSKNLGADTSLHKNNPMGRIPTTYRDLPFSEWLNILMAYAICLAREGRAKESYEICDSIDDSVVFCHSREDKFLTHLCWSLCALMSNDEEACVNQARFFMREYQFTSDSYRMYGALMRAIHSPVSWYSSGPSQKYVLRQIKCMDLALVDEDRRKRNNVGEKGSYSAVDEKGHLIINDDMDVCLLMMYGHILYTGQSYAYALNYFLRAHALDTNNPMIHLCIGLSYTHHALKRQCENRQHHILQGLSFMMKYYNARKESEHIEERQEAHYNIARIYHMLGMNHLALPYYQKVLDETAGGKRSNREDLVIDTAYNLQTMYAVAGNLELARKITERWLVI